MMGSGVIHMFRIPVRRSLLLVSVLALLFSVREAVAVEARQAGLPGAPAFSATGIDGKTVSSRQLAGKAYIVNFFASWCPPCRAEIPDMVALQKAYKVKGFTFIGVAMSDEENTVRSFMKSSGINYPVLMGNQQIVSSFGRYVEGGMRSIPTTFVVNRSGQITQVISGARGKAVFEKIILDALTPAKPAR
jgi:peroxiredoxin